MENEIFKDIHGYEELYQVSNCGTIKTIARKVYLRNGNNGHRNIKEKIRKPQKTHKGYLTIGLYNKEGKFKSIVIHRLVAQAFIPNPENKPEVNHINGIKSDNRVENLEWATSLENQLHALRTGLKQYPKKGDEARNRKINECDIIKIRGEYESTPNKNIHGFRENFYRIKSKEYNVSISCIDSIIRRNTWKHI